uniref:Uncharacterized protein n=1 Tax=Knipowitschia caucasica TaxID=637954 RepID=A0AAV2M3Y4_KNICA
MERDYNFRGETRGGEAHPHRDHNKRTCVCPCLCARGLHSGAARALPPSFIHRSCCRRRTVLCPVGLQTPCNRENEGLLRPSDPTDPGRYVHAVFSPNTSCFRGGFVQDSPR